VSDRWEQRGAQTQSRLAKDAAGAGDGDGAASVRSSSGCDKSCGDIVPGIDLLVS